MRQGAAMFAALIGITLSVIAYLWVGSWEGERRKFDFERLAETRCLLFENKANRHLDKFKALGQFYDGSQFVDRDEFIQFTAPILINHPEIHALGWAPRITHVNRNDFERVLQEEGLADCYIHNSSHLGNTAVASDREEYYPILYRLPQLDWAMGLDMLSKPHQRKAIERARDLGQPTITGPILIPCEHGNKLAVIAYRPVYEKDSPISTIEERRAAIRGVVFSAVRVTAVCYFFQNS
jgi:CHASE1-domain containing sensor protein